MYNSLERYKPLSLQTFESSRAVVDVAEIHHPASPNGRFVRGVVVLDGSGIRECSRVVRACQDHVATQIAEELEDARAVSYLRSQGVLVCMAYIDRHTPAL